MGLLLLAAFFSGFAALNYQLLWIRELTLIVGSSQAAVTCVLSVFFTGLALGNYLASRFSARLACPTKAYFVVEVVIAAWVIALFFMFDFFGDIYGNFYRNFTPGSIATQWVRILGATGLLLVPTTCMGATLPLLCQFGTRSLTGASRWSSLVYGVNTLGAMIGAAVTGFLLIEHLGVSRTMWVSAGISLLAAVCAVPSFRRTPITQPTRDDTTEGLGIVMSRSHRWLILAFGLLGFCNIAVEVLWTRYFGLIFFNDTYIYSTILIVYLFGVGFGSIAGAPLVKRVGDPVFALGIVQIVSAFWMLAMMAVIPAMLGGVDLQPDDYNQVLRSYFQVVSVGILIPTLCMGLTFPLLVRAVLERSTKVGQVVGRALAWNTIGGVFGAAVAGYVLLDWLGLQVGLLLVAGVVSAIGLFLIFAMSAARPVQKLVGAVISVAGVLIVVAFPPDLPRSLLEMQFPLGGGLRIVETRPSVHGTVTVTEEDTGEKRLWINGVWVARESAHTIMGYVPWLLHPGPANKGLGICCGTGRTFGALLNVGIESLDMVEINPAVIDVGIKWFSDANHGVLTAPNAEVIIEDGRNFVRYTDRTYDLITLEPLQMFQKGVVYFYTREFYQEARARLNENGVLCQWLPIYLINEHEMKSMIHTFVDTFDHALLWGQGVDFLLLGFNTPGQRLDFDESLIYERLATDTIREDLADRWMYDRYDAFIFALAGGDTLVELSQGGDVYTDDRPQLEFTAPRNRNQNRLAAANRAILREHMTPMNVLFDLPNRRDANDLSKLRTLFIDLGGAADRTEHERITMAIIAARRALYRR